MRNCTVTRWSVRLKPLSDRPKEKTAPGVAVGGKKGKNRATEYSNWRVGVLGQRKQRHGNQSEEKDTEKTDCTSQITQIIGVLEGLEEGGHNHGRMGERGGVDDKTLCGGRKNFGDTEMGGKQLQKQYKDFSFSAEQILRVNLAVERVTIKGTMMGAEQKKIKGKGQGPRCTSEFRGTQRKHRARCGRGQ